MFTSTYSNKQNAIARFATTSIASLLVSGAMILTTGCSDDSSSPAGAATDISKSDDGDAMVFEMQDGTYELNITAEGPWHIEDSTHFVQSISQTEGTGPATVELKVLTNDLDERLEGNLFIVSDDPNQDRTIKCVQKYYGDYGENAPSDIGKSNKIYAVGYGYNAITGAYADHSSLKAEIFNTKSLIEEFNGITLSPTSVDYHEKTFTGSTIADISYELGSRVGVSGKIAKFETEMKSSYDLKVAAQDTFEFAMTYLNMVTQTVGLDIGVDDIKSDPENFMKKSAYDAINGLNKNYKTSNEGFKKLIRTYGTHVVVGAALGGRIRQSMTANVANISTQFDMKTFARAAYSGAIAKTKDTVDSKLSMSLKANLENMDIKVNVKGGDNLLAVKLTDSKILNPEDIKNWKESVTKTENASFIDLAGDGVLPIYELIDEDLGPEAKERKQKLKDYMEGKDVIADFSTYECGTVTVIDVPKIEDKENNTLVKDIYSSGQLIAKAVLEYIPNQNYKEKIMVIYPVINNKVRFNMGFFIGDKTHKPARVSWDGTDVAIIEDADLDFGAVNKLYIRGSSVMAEAPNGTTPLAGRIEDSYLKAQKYFGKIAPPYKVISSVNVDYKYPLVKVFNHIWTRENYSTTVDKYGNPMITGAKNSDNKNSKVGVYHETTIKDPTTGQYNINLMFRNYIALRDYAPAGWRIPDTTAFKEIANKLEANGFTKITNAMLSKKDCRAAGESSDCGLLGLDLNTLDVSYVPSNLTYLQYATNSSKAVLYALVGGSTVKYRNVETDKNMVTDVYVRLIQN